MSRRIVTSAHVDEGGALHVHHRDSFERRIAEQFKDKRVRVTVEKETRNLQQNALLWVWNTLLGNELGWTPDEIHEYTKSEINRKHKMVTDKRTGELVDAVFPGDTHTLTVDEFGEYLERYVQFWGEKGYSLPTTPEDKWR